MAEGVPVPAASPPRPRQRRWLWVVLIVVVLLFGSLLATCWLTFSLVGALAGTGPGGRGVYRAEVVQGPPWGPEIAVVMLQGPIVSTGGGTQQVIAAQDVVDLVRRLNRDPDVRALVLFISSPGGGVAPSERIYNALRQVEKPIVAYLDDVAASGGYYIAVAADEIVANPGVLTGSIGVIAVFPYAEELLDRVGIGFTVIKSGPAKDMGGFYRRLTPEEQAHIQAIVDGMYGRFVQVVAEGRDMSEDEVRALADGRIYSGEQAYRLGLVDRLGYEQDAIERARELAGLSPGVRVVRYSTARPLFSLFGMAGRTALPWETLLQPGVYYLWLP